MQSRVYITMVGATVLSGPSVSMALMNSLPDGIRLIRYSLALSIYLSLLLSLCLSLSLPDCIRLMLYSVLR